METRLCVGFDRKNPDADWNDARGELRAGITSGITAPLEADGLTWFVATSANEKEREPWRPLAWQGDNRRGSSRAHEAPPRSDRGIGRLGGSPPSDLDEKFTGSATAPRRQGR